MISQLIILLVIAINLYTPIEEPIVTNDENNNNVAITAETEKIVEEKEEKESLGVFKLTAYCGCSKCCGNSNGITASGTKVKAGRTIAASSELAFGTQVEIDNHIYTVEDRGGAIKGKRIDIYFNTHQEALQFGVQNKEVFLIK